MRAVRPAVSSAIGSAVGSAVGSAARIAALAAFALRTNLRSGLALGGLLMAVAVMLVGPVLAVTRGLAWSFDGEFGFFGFLVLVLFALRSGHQEQRELGMTVYFRRNLVSGVEHALAMVGSALAAWTAVCVAGFLATLAISGGDASTAAWYTASWGLRALLLVGFVPLVEQTASFRLPFLLPALGYLVLLVALTIVLPEGEALALFVPTEPGDVRALGRLALQAGILVPITSAAFVLLVIADPWIRQRAGRLRLRRRRRTRSSFLSGR